MQHAQSGRQECDESVFLGLKSGPVWNFVLLSCSSLHVLSAVRQPAALGSGLWASFLNRDGDHGNLLLPASRPSHGGTRRGLPPIGVRLLYQLQRIALRGTSTKGARCRGTNWNAGAAPSAGVACLQGCVRPALSGVPLPLAATPQQWSGGNRHRIDRQHRAVPWSVSYPAIVPPLDRISAVELQLGRQTAGTVRGCHRRQEARSAHSQDGRYQACDLGSAW